MTSVVRFEEWQEPTGTTAATVDSSGNVSLSGDLSVSGSVTSTGNPQGLTLVKSVTVGQGVSTVTVTGAFDSRFDNYKITINEITQSDNQPSLRINFGGSTGNHHTVGWYMGLSSGSLTGNRSFNDNSCIFGETSGAGATGSYELEVLYPYATKRTHFNAQNASATWGSSYVGVHNSSTSHTSFTILPSSGTLTGGTIRVYGYGQ